MGEPVREGWCSTGDWVLRHAVIEVLDHVANPRERTVVEEGARVFELPQGDHPELECIIVAEGNFLSALIVEIGIVAGQAVQRLEGGIADSDIYEVFFDQLSDASHIRIIVLLVEHGAAVAGEASGSALAAGCRSEEELRAAELRRCE